MRYTLLINLLTSLTFVYCDVNFKNRGGVVCSRCLGGSTFNCIYEKQNLLTKWDCSDWRTSGYNTCEPRGFWQYSESSARSNCEDCNGYFIVDHSC